MPDAVPLVLWSWVPITLALFWKLPPARAAVACLLGGWLILPTARFADDVASVAFPYWIMPACLPADQWTTKARVIGVALLLGVMAFDPGAWRRLRPTWLDGPMLGWCLVPIASGLANGLGVLGPVADSAYLALSWGVPYLVGRLYFGDPPGIEAFGRGLVASGLCALPFAVLEFAAGPVLYAGLYGFHPYRTPGMERYVGYRPVLFFEDGNQLGIWLAASALAAAWLWRSGRLDRFAGIPGPAVAAILVGQAILTQSAGAVALLAAALLGLEAIRRLDRTWPVAAALGLILLLVGARAANLVDAKALAMKTGVGRGLVEAATGAGRGSFGWRMRVEERAARVALRHPGLGSGRWDWWRAGTEGERPWGLPILVLGQYGLVGWLALLATFAAPTFAFLRLGPPRFWGSTRAGAAAAAGVLSIAGLDAILNPGLPLPLLAGAGGLVGLKGHAAASAAWARRLQGVRA